MIWSLIQLYEIANLAGSNIELWRYFKPVKIFGTIGYEFIFYPQNLNYDICLYFSRSENIFRRVEEHDCVIFLTRGLRVPFLSQPAALKAYRHP